METGGKVASGLVDLVKEAKDLVYEVRTEYTIKETIQNANVSSLQVKLNTADLGPIMKNIRQVSDLRAARGLCHCQGGARHEQRPSEKARPVETELAKTLGQADKGMSEAEGAVKDVRSILNSNEDNIASLIAHLNETSRNLDGLTEDVRLHPWKVLWKADGTVDPASLMRRNGGKKEESGHMGRNSAFILAFLIFLSACASEGRDPYNKAVEQYSMGHLGESVETYKQAIILNPSDPRAEIQPGRNLPGPGKTGGSRKALQRISSSKIPGLPRHGPTLRPSRRNVGMPMRLKSPTGEPCRQTRKVARRQASSAIFC